ncbi:MAG: cytochrome C, partial [Deltaproteobacteria bacterium]
MKKIGFFFLGWFILSIWSLSYAIDVENCLLCHKYRGLSYIDKEGNFHLLYITPDLYENSPHGILKCTDCHQGITDFPHKPEHIKKVNCLSICHNIKEPTSGKPFSHRKVLQDLEKSVHYVKNIKTHPEDAPTCITCHFDPIYRPLAFFKRPRPGADRRTLTRCFLCHEDKSYIRKFYAHFSSRMQKFTDPKEIVERCAYCHEDADFLKRHNFANVVFSYKETFHGKALFYGKEDVPDCVDCHSLPYRSAHFILPKDDPSSPTNKKNAYKTCAQIDCHPNGG